MKIHHFIKDSIAMAKNEAVAEKERQKINKKHEPREEYNRSDVPTSGPGEAPAEKDDAGGGEGSQEAQTRQTKKKKKAQKDV